MEKNYAILWGSSIFPIQLSDNNEMVNIPSDLDKQGVFELFVIIELFTVYLNSKIILTENQIKTNKSS